MQILSSQPVSLDSLGEVFTVPLGDYNKFSCEFVGDIGSGVVDILRKVSIDSPAEYDFGTPIEFATATTSHFNVDVSGVGGVVFTVTTADAGKSIQINTLAERY